MATPSSPSIALPRAARPSSSEDVIEKCKNDISALCSSIVQLRLHDRSSIDVLQRDTDWMHSLSLLALLFRIGPAQPPEAPTATMEGLAADVRRLAELCDLLEGRQSGTESSAPGPVEQSTPNQQPPTYEEVGDAVSIFITPQIGSATSHSASVHSMVPSSSTSAFHLTHERTYFYIHTRINPVFVTVTTPTQRTQIRSVVDPRGVGMRLLGLPKLHLLSTGEIIIILEDEEAATRAKNRLTEKLPAILRKAYIVRWPGTPTPYLIFKITSIIPTPSTTATFRQMLRESGVARKQFLATKIMEASPILRLHTADQIPDEEKFLADAEILVLVLEGSTPLFAQDFAMMNPKIGVEGVTLAVSASVASDVPNWRNSVVDWNAD